MDEIRWVPVPEVATRVAQVETGELDFADDLNLDSYDRLKKNANARPIVSKPYYWLVAVMNKKEGLMTNQKLRQAWQAAIDIEPIMKNVAGGRAEFYRMDSSLAPVEISAWYTKLTGLPWNEHNKDKAKRLLQEAGYKKEPIRFMTTQEYKWMYDFALLTKQQLEDIGFNIDLQVVDWATLVKRRNNSKEYDVFTTGIGAFYDPTHAVFLTRAGPAGPPTRTSRGSSPSWRARRIPRSVWPCGSSRRGSSTRRCRSSGTAISSVCGRRATRSRTSTRRPSACASTTSGWRSKTRT